MFRKNILNTIATSLTLILLFAIVLAEDIPFLVAPQTAYPSLANPPIKPYDRVALLAIVNLINPPHLKLTRVPARLLDKNYYKPKNELQISGKQFNDLPHFDTPTFEDFPQIDSIKNITVEINENKISNTENWNSLNHTANANLTINKSKHRLESAVADKKASPIIFNTKENKTHEDSNILEKISGRSADLRLDAKPLSSDYSYNYSVSDEGHKDVKSHSEARTGDIVTGEYSILEPDGYTRVVKYYSDSSSGFKARVTRIAPLKTNII